MKLKNMFFLSLIISSITISANSNSPYLNVLNNRDFNPILLLKFTVKEPYAICEALSLLPVTYSIRVLNPFKHLSEFSINNNVVDMKYGWGNYLIICEAKISFDNSTWTKTTLMSYSFHISRNRVRLFNGSKPNEGLIQFYYAGVWRHPCDDDFNNDVAGRRNGAVVCKELGYPGIAVMKSDGTFGTKKHFFMDEVQCAGNEFSLLNCSSQIGPYSHNCGSSENPAGVICKSKSNDVKMMALKIFHFESNPADNLDINQQIEIKCIVEISSEMYFSFEIGRMKGSSGKMSSIFDINSNISIISFTTTSTKISITYILMPDKKYSNDTLICRATDVTSGLVERKELFLEYKYPIERLTLEPFTNVSGILTNTSDSKSQYSQNAPASNYPSNSSAAEEQDLKNASQIKCTSDYEVDDAIFTWLYAGVNGTNVVKGPILDLKNVERRLPLCCRVDHELRSGPYNISKCITIQELPETPIVRTSTFCGTRTLNVECPESTDMVFSSIHAGYANSCSQTDYDHCQHHTVTNFIREERCAENSCRIFAGLFKKSYFMPILASLPPDCLNETKPFVKMDYYCLDKFNSTVL